MEEVARELAQTLGNGPVHHVREAVRALFPGIESLVVQLDLQNFSQPYAVTASTPNIIEFPSSGQHWQLGLTQSQDAAQWIQMRQFNTTTQSLYQRPPTTTNNTNTHTTELMARILEPSTSTQLGCVILTAPPALLTSPALQQSLTQFAAALSLQHETLVEFNTAVGSALFGPPHTPSPSDDDEHGGSDDDINDDRDGIGENEYDDDYGDDDTTSHSDVAHEYDDDRRINRDRGRQQQRGRWRSLLGRRLPPFFASVSPLSLTAALSFLDPTDEQLFLHWHAQHMWKFDVGALGMCVALQTMLVFTSITQFELLKSVVAWKWAVGYIQLVLIVVMCSQRGRRWYCSHRDLVLIALQLVMLWYHHTLMNNFRPPIGPNVLLKCSGVTYSFVWLPFVTLVFQARFRLLAPVIVLSTAVNLTLLRDMCGQCEGGGGARCIGRGAGKVVGMVGATLTAVYCIEWRARRVWALTRERQVRMQELERRRR